ncbi:hypothetical protein [Nonomuraea longicatena]|uniref:Uncharacterized protein n=1 Tax=Nonomuraea longicatena TaxID=83682 RepID=A0ABN1RE05_9ACTN
MDQVEVVNEEVLYSRPGRARVERTSYSNGVIDYGVWVQTGVPPVETSAAFMHVPHEVNGAPVALAELIHDDGLVGMIYRKAA